MALLTQEQYNILNEQRNAMESYVKTKYCRNLPREWLHKAALINMSIYKAPYADISCPPCIGQLLTRMLNPVIDYETEAKMKAKEAEAAKEVIVLQAEQETDIPRRGRKPKQWTK